MLTIITKALTALAITTFTALGADNSIGTWKLNVEKSKSHLHQCLLKA